MTTEATTIDQAPANAATTEKAAAPAKTPGKTPPAPTKPAGAPRGGKKGRAAPKPRKSAKQPPKAATKAAQGSGKAKPEAAKGTGQARKPGTDTKQARLITMLRQPDGATIDDVAKAFGWQPHTVRGALYGALKKKLDLNVTSEKVEGRGRVYRIAG